KDEPKNRKFRIESSSARAKRPRICASRRETQSAHADSRSDDVLARNSAGRRSSRNDSRIAFASAYGIFVTASWARVDVGVTAMTVARTAHAASFSHRARERVAGIMGGTLSASAWHK